MSPLPPPPPPTATVIAAQRLTKEFGSLRALNELDLAVGRGVTGLVGANGAGKTTLMSILLGLQYASVGSVTVLGLNPVEHGAQIRSQVGWAPERNLFPGDMRAFDYVRHLAEVKGLPRHDARARSSDSLELVGLGEERFRLLKTMSTGQRQRVKLAQAIAAAPRLVMLDEPTDGLDPMQRDSMLTLIRSISSDFGIDVLLSSHLLGEVERVCDNVIALDGGQLVAAGTVADLLGGDNRLRIEFAAPVGGEMRAWLAQRIAGPDADLEVEFSGPDVEPTVTVWGPVTPDQVADRCRDAIAEAQVPIRYLAVGQRSLDDLFIDREPA